MVNLRDSALRDLKDPQVTPNNFKYYEHRFTHMEEKIGIGHFQLLRNLKAVSPYDVFFATSYGVNRFSFKTLKPSKTIFSDAKLDHNYSVFDVH